MKGSLQTILALFFIGLNLALAPLSAQQLTYSQALRHTLENNYGIRIARQDQAIAKNNASRENTGFFPTADFSAGGDYSLGGSTQKFGNGNENKVAGAGTLRGNASVGAQYTIFNKSRDYTLAQLQEVLSLTDLQFRQTIEANVLQLATAYYDIAQLAANLSALQETIEVSNRRMERVNYQYQYGQGIRLDLLNAEVDVRRDSINYLNAAQQLSNAKRNLNLIMGQDGEEPFEVDTAVSYDPDVSLNDLITEAKHENIAIKLLEKNVDITKVDFDIIESSKKPVLTANASYTYSFQDSPEGSFITLSTSQGLGLGLGLAWNLYDGGVRKVRTANAKINLETLEIQKEEVEQQIETDVFNAWESYQNALKILEAEGSNLAVNQLNLQRTEEQFNIGQVTSVEFRQAQLNLINARTSYNAAKFDAKIIEVQMMQLAGRLLN